MYGNATHDWIVGFAERLRKRQPGEAMPPFIDNGPLFFTPKVTPTSGPTMSASPDASMALSSSVQEASDPACRVCGGLKSKHASVLDLLAERCAGYFDEQHPNMIDRIVSRIALLFEPPSQETRMNMLLVTEAELRTIIGDEVKREAMSHASAKVPISDMSKGQP